MTHSLLSHLPPGFTARPCTLVDAQAATDIFIAAARKYPGWPEFSLAQTLAFWQTPGYDLAQNSRLVLAPDGRPAAQIDIDDTDAVPLHVKLWGRVHPDFEGSGLGSAMLTWAERQARSVFSRVPPNTAVSLFADAPTTAVPAINLLQDSGFDHVRDYWKMVIELTEEPPPPTWPDGIRLTTLAQWPDLTAVVAAEEEAFQDHWGHVEQPLDEAVRKTRHWLEEDPEHDPAGWLIALAGDDVAGICLCRQREFADPDKGWVSVLAVRRPYRGQGLGKALLQHSFGMFYQHGRRRVGLNVDAASLTGATRLYESVGMEVENQKGLFEKKLPNDL